MDTSTSYLGLRLAHPFMAGASPLGAHLDAVRRLEDGGCAALVLPSLFEEQITMASSGRVHHVDPLDAEFAASVAEFPRSRRTRSDRRSTSNTCTASAARSAFR